MTAEEKIPFFDLREDISSISESGLDCADVSGSEQQFIDWISENFQYELWIERPESVGLKWTGVES